MNKRSDSPQLPDHFWQLIDTLRLQPELAEDLIRTWSQEELSQFYYDYRHATEELFPGDYEGTEALSDEDISKVSSWVVAQGKDYYLRVWDDFSLAPHPDSVSYPEYPGLVAAVCHEKYGKELLG